MTKTKKNNYDKSSTGIDIECSCFHDTELSRMNFQENFENLQRDRYRTTSVNYYIDNGNIPDSSEVKFSVKGERETKIKHLVSITCFDAEEIQTWDNDTLDSEIIGHEEDVNLINYALEKLPVIAGLEFIPNKNLIVLTTTGYSQGDYAAVIYCPEDLEKAWGKMPEQKTIQSLVDHYFWDAPIYASFEINGKEYNYHDMPEYDEYEWEREKFITYVSKESGIDAETLKAFVPDYPEYL